MNLEQALQNLQYALQKAAKQDVFNVLEIATINESLVVIEKDIKKEKKQDE